MAFSDLVTFLLVVELGSFTATADALEVSQPAITQRIRRLEKQLGTRLLVRHTRVSEPTAAGKKLVESLPGAFDVLSDAILDAAPQTKPDKLAVVIATTPFLASGQLPRLIRSFTNRVDAKVVVLDLSYNGVLEAINMGRAHLAILSDYRGAGPLAELIGEVDVVLAANPSHPLARLDTVTLEQVSDQEIIFNHQYDHLFKEILSAASMQGISTTPIGNRVQGMSTVVGMVDAALGLGLVTRTVAEVYCSPQTSILTIEGLDLRRKYSLLQSDAPRPEQEADLLIDHIRAQFSRDHPMSR